MDKECHEISSSGYDIASVLMSSQQLSWPKWDLDMSKQAETAVEMG